VTDRPRPGRPRALSQSQVATLRTVIRERPKSTAKYIVGVLARDHGVRISTRTVWRYRRQLGFRPRVERVELRPTSLQLRKRKSSARANRHADLKRWLFADETYVGLRHTMGVVWLERGAPQPKRSIEGLRAQFGIWGVVGWNFKRFTVYEGYANAARYKGWLTSYVGPSAHRFMGHSFVHDGASYHRTPAVRNWLTDKSITELDFPPKSPALNAIEYCWGWIKHNVDQQSPATKAQLKRAIKSAIDEIPQHVIQSFIKHVADEMKTEANKR
jgi:transposase